MAEDKKESLENLEEALKETFNHLAENMQDPDPEIDAVIAENFWDLF